MLTHPITVPILGGLLILLGLAGMYWVGRNRFRRRGAGGLQHYSGYNRALLTTFFESMLRLLGLALVVIGLFLIGVYWFNQRTAEKSRQQQRTEAPTPPA